VWIPRRRRLVFIGPVAERLKVLIHAVAALEVLPDHVHLFLNCPPTVALYHLLFLIKGRTARVLREEFLRLLKLPSMYRAPPSSGISRSKPRACAPQGTIHPTPQAVGFLEGFCKKVTAKSKI
jgi:hypothetical protein